MPATALLLAACAPVTPPATAADARTQGAALQKSCEGRDGWSDPAPPARIFGSTYYVGTCGIAVILVTSPKGHVLIDGATAEAVPSILANIRVLGFDPRDIEYLVGSHEHLDHMGGFAALKAATGAKLMVSAAARPVVETGRTNPADPQAGEIPDMAPVAVDGILTFEPEPGDIITGKPTRLLSLTPHATPGHTDGGTSWTWKSCEGKTCITFAYVDSLTAVSRDGYRFTHHPERVAPFRETFERVAQLPCDILITPHPGISNLFPRLAGAEPLIDASACRRLADAMRTRLDTRLAREAAK
ncbi:MAG: subclass B3 metallo-beta-lactamase [Sphingomonadaceae bacterium]|nr:subclass B3 metallo-beta-lactamase [Sphingomonadaceae bacterium]